MRVVVHAGGVDVQHFAPEHLLRRADIADARQELFEIPSIVTALEALIIQQYAFAQVGLELLRGPTAELRASVRLRPVANG